MPRSTESITLDGGPIEINLTGMSARVNALIAGVVDYEAGESTRMMKEKAPWKDRTGNARATLEGTPAHKGYVHTLTLHGGMPYQIWLETRWAGKYSIIAKSVLPVGRQVMETLRALFERI